MFESPTFWTAVGFVILIAGIAKPVWKGITGALDTRADKIKAALDEATQLREESQRLLAEYQRKQRDATKECKDMLSRAATEAEVLADEAASALKAALKRREELALEKIVQAEAEAVQQVREVTVDIAVAATRSILERRVDTDTGAALVERAISDLPTKLN